MPQEPNKTKQGNLQIGPPDRVSGCNLPALLPEPCLLIDPEGFILQSNLAFAARFRKSPEECRGLNLYTLFSQTLLKPDIAALWKSKAEEALRTAKPLFFDDEEERPLRHTFYPLSSSDTPAGLLIISEEITVQKQLQLPWEQEEKFRKVIFNTIPGMFYLMEGSGLFVLWNDYLRDVVMGKTESEMASTNALEGIHPDDRGFVMEKIQQIFRSGNEDSTVARALLQGGPRFIWVLLTGRRVIINNTPFMLGIGSDITQQKKTESELQKLNRAHQAISKCNEALQHAESESELLQKICTIVVEAGGYSMVWVGYAENDPAKSVRPVAQAGFEEGYLEALQVSWADMERGGGPTGRAIRTGEPCAIHDIQNDPTFAPWIEQAVAQGYESALALPLKNGAQPFGALTIYSLRPNAFTSEEIKLLAALADNLAYGITMLQNRLAHAEAEERVRQSELRYRSIFDNQKTAMLLIDPESGMIIEANPAATTFYGWTHDELCQMNLSRINLGGEGAVRSAMQRALNDEVSTFTPRHLRANGSIRDVEVFSAPITVQGKTLLYNVVHDITDRVHFEATTTFHISILEQSESHSIEDLLRVTLDEAERQTGSSIGFFHFVAEDQVSLSMQAWSTNTAQKMCQAKGERQHDALDKAGVWADALRLRRTVIHNDYHSLEHRKGVPEGHAEVVREMVVPVLRGGKVVATLGVGNKTSNYDENDSSWVGRLADIAWDIVAKKIAEEEKRQLQTRHYIIEHMAMHDSLTGLPNRRLISDRIDQAVGQCQRSRSKAALMIFDLDDFKTVNDTFGHGVGDELLEEVANRTLGVLQRSNDTLARLGGDEFAVLLPHIAAPSNSMATAEKIRLALEEPFCIEGHNITISCSIGIAVFPDHGEEELTLMKHADTAMYQSKSKGGNCVTVFDGNAA